MQPHFILFVADQAASTRFYRNVLDREPRLDVPGMTEFVLGSGPAVLGLMPLAGSQRLLGPVCGGELARCELYLRVDDAATLLQRALAAGASPLSPLQARDWGDRAGDVRDPDGHIVAFAENLAPGDWPVGPESGPLDPQGHPLPPPSRGDLRGFPLFAGLSANDAALLQQSTACRHFPAGARLFEEGDPAFGFYLVRVGSVKIYKISPRGQEQVLNVVGPGGSFGEAAVFAGHGYPAAAECLQASELIFIERQMLIRLLSRDPEMALRMMVGMSLKLRRLVSMVEDLTLRDARGRLCRYLFQLVQSSSGGTTVKLPTQQNVLACLLGLTVETLSRTLRCLKDDGILEVSRKGLVEIHCLASLRAAAGEDETEPGRGPDENMT